MTRSTEGSFDEVEKGWYKGVQEWTTYRSSRWAWWYVDLAFAKVRPPTFRPTDGTLPEESSPKKAPDLSLRFIFIPPFFLVYVS